ncbi:MAG: hypothetical protein COA99_13455 [Moraxellaceae bacterium]|nr:MAG: hypothetical protein COA99_13455 [Moraxellaceae bacterium]
MTNKIVNERKVKNETTFGSPSQDTGDSKKAYSTLNPHNTTTIDENPLSFIEEAPNDDAPRIQDAKTNTSQANDVHLLLQRKNQALSTSNRLMQLAKDLSDTSFSQPVSINLLPLVYGLSIIALTIGILAVSINTMYISLPFGLFFLLLLGPVIFVIGVIVIRLVLEIISAILQMQSHTGGMAEGLNQVEDRIDDLQHQLKIMLNNTENLTDTVSNVDDNIEQFGTIINDLQGLSDRILFFKSKNRKKKISQE